MKHMASILVLAACASSEAPASQLARIGTVVYEAPDGWDHKDTISARSASVTWTPDANTRRESITVIRSRIDPNRTDAKSLDSLEQLLLAAQHELPHLQLTRTQRFHTRNGLDGVQVDADFVPIGKTEPYHQTHAVLVSVLRAMIVTT